MGWNHIFLFQAFVMCAVCTKLLISCFSYFLFQFEEQLLIIWFYLVQFDWMVFTLVLLNACASMFTKDWFIGSNFLMANFAWRLNSSMRRLVYSLDLHNCIGLFVDCWTSYPSNTIIHNVWSIMLRTYIYRWCRLMTLLIIRFVISTT